MRSPHFPGGSLARKMGWLPVFLLLGGALAGGLGAQAAETNYTGHYELADVHADQSFSLDVTQTGSRAAISFSASMADGSGAAPDGDGKGALGARGELQFTFKDSLGNEGNGTLRHERDGYHLKLEMSLVADPRPLHFYGDVLLRKTADQPSP